MTNQKRLLSQEEFMKDRQKYTTELTITMKCQVTTHASSNAEAIKWATAYVLTGIEDADFGDAVSRPVVKAKVIKKSRLARKEKEKLLKTERRKDGHGNEGYII